MRRNTQSILTVLMLLVVFVGNGLAQEQKKDLFGDKPSAGRKCPLSKPMPKPSAEEEARARIEKALEEKTTLKFHNHPLGDVVAYLSKKHKIPIRLHGSLEEVGIGNDTPVTCTADNITLRSALRLLLADLDLTYWIDHEVLYIITLDRVEENRNARFYIVNDLVTFQDEKGETWSDFDSLMYLIVVTTCPETWTEFGGSGTVEDFQFGTAKVLVVKQTEDVHHEIDVLLKNLRAIVAQMPDAGGVPFKRRPDKASLRFRELQYLLPSSGGMGRMGAPSDDSTKPPAEAVDSQPKPSSPRP